MHVRRIVVGAIFLALLPVIALAQTPPAAVAGVARDGAGGVLPGATVRVVIPQRAPSHR